MDLELNRRAFLRLSIGAPLLTATPVASREAPASTTQLFRRRRYVLAGQLRQTFGSALLFPFRATIGSFGAESSDGAYRVADLPGGTYDVVFEGAGLARKRTRTGVRLTADTRLDLDAMASGDVIDVDSYREMCMGINPPGEPGGSINRGVSRRARSGTTFRILVVRNADVPSPDVYFDIINEARTIFPVITGGAVSSTALEIIDREPVPVPQGSIVVLFENAISHGAPRDRGEYISSGGVVLSSRARITNPVIRPRIVRLVKHEFCHVLGFDHTRNAKSLMHATDNGSTSPIELQDVSDPSPEDIRNGSLKYSRSPGHQLSALEDRDPVAP